MTRTIYTVVHFICGLGAFVWHFVEEVVKLVWHVIKQVVKLGYSKKHVQQESVSPLQDYCNKKLRAQADTQAEVCEMPVLSSVNLNEKC